MVARRYRLVPGKADEKLEATARVASAAFYLFVKTTMERARSNTAVRTPRGWSGALADAYQTETRRGAGGKVTGILANPMLYHDVREDGRNPGKQPPVSALIPWVGSKLGVPPADRPAVAFLVARKIGRAGYEGAHMVADGWDETRDQIKPELKELGLRIVKAAR